MRLWARIRLLPWQVATVVAIVGVAALADGIVVPTPDASGAAGGVALPLLLPLVFTVVFLVALASGSAALESQAARGIGRLDGALLLALLAVMALAVACVGLLGLSDEWSVLRNAAGYTGLALVVGRVVGPDVGAAAAVAAALVCAVFGRYGDGAVRSWALVIAPPTSLVSWLLAAILLAAGLVARFGGPPAAHRRPRSD